MLNRTHLTTIAAGAVFAFSGAIQATHSFDADEMKINSTAEYLVTGALPISLVLLVPMYLLLGRLAGRPKAGRVAVGAMLALALITTSSVIRGEDLQIFQVVAPLSLVTWLGASVILARGLLRTGALPKAVAYAIPALLVVTFPLASIGGPLVTGAFWIALALRMAREPRALAQPAVA